MSMQISATQKRIEEQCRIKRPRYHNKATGKRYVLIFEVAGTCELQGIDGRSTYAKREDLDNAEVWGEIV